MQKQHQIINLARLFLLCKQMESIVTNLCSRFGRFYNQAKN